MPEIKKKKKAGVSSKLVRTTCSLSADDGRSSVAVLIGRASGKPGAEIIFHREICPPSRCKSRTQEYDEELEREV